MALSAVVTQLVGTTLLSLPVLLPGPSIQPSDCALATGASAVLKLRSSVQTAVNVAVVIGSSLLITTLPLKCLSWGSPGEFPGAGDPIGRRDRFGLLLHPLDQRCRATRLLHGRAKPPVLTGR